MPTTMLRTSKNRGQKPHRPADPDKDRGSEVRLSEQRSTAVSECRMYFLRAADDHPEIRLGDSLYEEVFKPCRKLWAELGLPVPQVSEWTPEQYDALERYRPEKARLIEHWAAKHHLNFDWVHHAAYDVLVYCDFPKHPFATTPGYRPTGQTLETWHFDYERERDYRKRARANFRSQLENHIRMVRRLRTEFLPDRGARSTHYRWAVEHVCLERGWTEIAEKHKGRSVDPQAVREAVLKILDKIGIAPSKLTTRKKRAS